MLGISVARYVAYLSSSNTMEAADLQGTTRRTEARSDNDCVADDRTVQYLIRNLIQSDPTCFPDPTSLCGPGPLLFSNDKTPVPAVKCAD
jgi:hypothetical protein